jgi:hypothetical protein
LPHLVIERERVEQDKWRTFAVFMGNNWLHDAFSFKQTPLFVIPRDSSFSHLDSVYLHYSSYGSIAE